MKKSLYLPGLLAACFMLLSVVVKATLPTITTNPKNDTVCAGVHTAFFIAVNDTPDTSPITIVWQVSTDGSTWSSLSDTTIDTVVYSGMTSDTLHVIAHNMLNGYLYRAIATDTSGSDTSLAAMLKVDTLDAGVITGPSVVSGLGSVCVGSTTTLADAISGGVWSHINHLADTLDPTTANVTGLARGFDTIKYVVTNVCGAAITQITMRVDTIVVALPITGPATTCVGHTIDLANENVLGTWSWNPSNGHAGVATDGTLTGLSYGKDTITYAFTNACNSVASTIVVQVDTLLNHGVISGDTAVCTGSWTALSETVGGGVWISSNTDVAVIDGSGNVTGISQGTVTISYYLANGCGASVATHTLHVARGASDITGIDSVGIGGTRTLSDSTIGGTWSINISDTSIATINGTTGTVTGVGAGVTTVTYSVTNVCGTSMATATFYVGSAPYVHGINGPGSVCIGSTITLTDTTLGGTWSSSNDTIASIDPVTGVVTGNISGTVNISYMFNNGFGTTTVVRSIFVDHKPVISLTGPNTVALGGNYFFRATPPDGTFSATSPTMGLIVSVLDSNYGGVAYVTFASFVVVNAGRDTIHYRYTNECGTADSIFVISLLPVRVNTLSNDGSTLDVYPNPNNGAITVNLTSGVTEDAVVTITNVVGEKVKEVKISTNTPTSLDLDHPNGIYILTANTSTGKYTAKISVAK